MFVRKSEATAIIQNANCSYHSIVCPVHLIHCNLLRLSKVRGLQHQKNVGGKSEACLEFFDCLLSRDFVRRSKRQEEVMSFNTRPSVKIFFL